MAKRGFPIVLSAPSGAGKTTLAHLLVDSGSNLSLSISYTTRECRGKERNKVDYNFVSSEQFDKMIASNFFLEWADVHHKRYGSDATWTEKTLSEGNNVIFDIDVQGGLQIKQNYPRTVLIFILPPSMEELQSRLTKRGTESKERISKRIDAAKKEINIGLSKYDYVINNGKLNRALFDLSAIVRTHTLLGFKHDKIIVHSKN